MVTFLSIDLVKNVSTDEVHKLTDERAVQNDGGM